LRLLEPNLPQALDKLTGTSATPHHFFIMLLLGLAQCPTEATTPIFCTLAKHTRLAMNGYPRNLTKPSVKIPQLFNEVRQTKPTQQLKLAS